MTEKPVKQRSPKPTAVTFFALAMVAHRRWKGMKQEEACEELGVSQQTYANWERGASTPRDAFDRKRVAKWLGISLGDMLVLMEQPYSPGVLIELAGLLQIDDAEYGDLSGG